MVLVIINSLILNQGVFNDEDEIVDDWKFLQT